MDCISNLIGVTNSIGDDLPFYADLDSDLKASILESSSGLFMDSLPGGIDLMGVDDAEYMANVLNLALKAKTEAERILYDELLLAINNRFQAAKPKFYGDIGRRTVSATLGTPTEYQGHRYRMLEPIAGVIKITRIAINLSGAATFNVHVAKCDSRERSFEVIKSFPVTTIAGQWVNADMTSVEGELILPMEVYGVPQDYYIFWRRSEAGNLYAKNNEIKCVTCSGVKAMQALNEFMDYSGIDFSDATKLQNISTNKRGYGLSVLAEVGCDHATVVCREFEKKEAVALMMKWANLYKAGELWIEYILKSAYINKTNLQSREYMWGKRNHFAAEFGKRITAIADEMTLGETNCYTCKNDKVIKGTIRA